MAPQFQQPNIQRAKTPAEAFVEGVGPSIQTLPQLYFQYKMLRQKQDMEALQLAGEKKKLEAIYGTGAPPPIQAGTMTPTVPQVGPEEQMFGIEGAMPTPKPETRAEQIKREGGYSFGLETDRMKAEQEKPSRSQLRVTDKNVSLLFDPVSGSLTVQGTGEVYDPSIHGAIRLPGDPNQSNEGIRREGLVKIGREAITEIRNSINSEVLRDLKIIRNDPTGGYEQVSSPKSKVVLNNLRTAIENQLYLKTGATATEDETRNAMRKFLAGISDTPGDFENRLKIIDRDFSGFTKTPSGGGVAIHDEALAWAQANPDDPRAQRILRLRGQ